jgi:hypothetical protein
LAFDFSLFSFLFFSTALFLNDALLFLFNGSLFLLQLLPDSITFSLLGSRVGGIVLIGLGSTLLLFIGNFFTDLCSPDFPNTLLDCADVDQLPNDFLGLVVNA